MNCSFSGDEANMAGYCEAALGRSLRVSGRLEGPSRLEATSVLTRYEDNLRK